MHHTYELAPQPPPIVARGMLTFRVSPHDLPQLAAWLDALHFIQIAPASVTEYGRWRTLDHEAMLVAWRNGTLLAQGRRPSQLASLLRAQIRDEQLPLFGFLQVTV